MERHKNGTLAIDVMFINKIPFVITTSRNIYIGTAKLVNDMKNKTILMSIKQVIQGFRVCTFLGDGQFRHLQKII